MICPKCFKHIDDESTFCTYCGETVERPQAIEIEGSYKNPQRANTQAIVSIILGAIGLIAAWIVALFGYALGGVSLGLSIAALKNDASCTKAKVGRVLAIITFVFSGINSLLGVIVMLGQGA